MKAFQMTLNRRSLFCLGLGAASSAALPGWALAALSGQDEYGAVVAVDRFQDVLLEQMVMSVPRTNNAVFKDYIDRRGVYINALASGQATTDRLVNDFAVPFARVVSSTFRSAAESDLSPALATATPRNTLRNEGGAIVIPPQTLCTYSTTGLCMDRALPAPVAGDALVLRPADERVPAELQDLMVAVANSSSRNDPNQARAQRLVWALMAAGTEEGDAVPASTLRELDAIVPGGSKRLQEYHAAKSRAAGRERFRSSGAAPERADDDARIAQELQRLRDAGERMDNGKGYGYSTVNKGALAARATGTGPLKASVEVLNDSDREVVFRPGSHTTKALARKQSAFPSQRITDESPDDYSAGGLRASVGPFNVDRASMLSKGLLFTAEQVAGLDSNLSKQSPQGRTIARDISGRRMGAVSSIVASHISRSPQAQNLLVVAQAATGRPWSQA
ncbi:hypothetical protein LJR118_006663 [Acidovorax sp. LjRoot118]|uniref:hypothetical protein n=1 Tax=Acidovorax sp. LjRoot118 TaxID=3342256 RepID=UPI003ECEB1CE